MAFPNFFKTQANIATVRGKLDATEAEIAVAENELARVSLDAALSDDRNVGFEAVANLSELKIRRELLTRALSAAEAAENQRMAEVRAKERASELRAIRQHIGRLIDASIAYQVGVQKMVDAWDTMNTAADAARKLLPAGPAGDNLRRIISYMNLRELGQTELNRLGARKEHDGRSSAPGTTHEILFQPKLTPEIGDDLRRRLLGAFAILSGKEPDNRPVPDASGWTREARVGETAQEPEAKNPAPAPDSPEAEAERAAIKAAMVKPAPLPLESPVAVMGAAEAPEGAIIVAVETEQAPVAAPVTPPKPRTILPKVRTA